MPRIARRRYCCGTGLDVTDLDAPEDPGDLYKASHRQGDQFTAGQRGRPATVDADFHHVIVDQHV